jgi:hypothetical protein
MKGTPLVPRLGGGVFADSHAQFVRGGSVSGDSVTLAGRSVVKRASDGRPYRYTKWGPLPERELYDLAADPGEYTNLANVPAYAGVMAELNPFLPA